MNFDTTALAEGGGSGNGKGYRVMPRGPDGSLGRPFYLSNLSLTSYALILSLGFVIFKINNS